MRLFVPGVIWLSYEVMTLRNLTHFFEVTADLGFSGERYLAYVSRQAFLNPIVRGINNLLSIFDRFFQPLGASLTGSGYDQGLGIFIYHTLNAVVLDVVVGGAFWFFLVYSITSFMARRVLSCPPQ